MSKLYEIIFGAGFRFVMFRLCSWSDQWISLSPLGHASMETASRAALGLFFTAEMIHQLRLLCSLKDGYHPNKGLYAHDYPHTQCTVWCFMVHVLCTYTYIPYNTG